MKRPDRAGSATVLAEFVSVIADIYGRADFDVIIKQLCAFKFMPSIKQVF